MRDKRLLEEFLEMGSGYVLDFSDRTFGEFCEEAVDVEIHSDKYLTHGSSKANKLRAFWEIESDYLAGQIRRMQDSVEKDPSLAIGTAKELIETCCKTILTARHARLAVGAASTLATFLLETHEAIKGAP
jgi:hypothetical protein